MLVISQLGGVLNARIRRHIYHSIERGPLQFVQGIVVHQTDSSTASATFNGYLNPQANGAHFLIDKDGSVYQTASIYKMTWHVGKIRSECYEKRSCSPVDMKAIQAARNIKSPRKAATKESNYELRKLHRDRFPSNNDSIGIELVGRALDVPGRRERVFETASSLQNLSLKWLVRELSETLRVEASRVLRHSEISRKNETEASSASWK